MNDINFLPTGTYTFDVWDYNQHYVFLNTESKIVCGYTNVTLSCGCCSNPEDFDLNWVDLDEDIQKQILEEITQKYNLL